MMRLFPARKPIPEPPSPPKAYSEKDRCIDIVYKHYNQEKWFDLEYGEDILDMLKEIMDEIANE